MLKRVFFTCMQQEMSTVIEVINGIKKGVIITKILVVAHL